MSSSVFEALKKLDITVDDHWTSDGLPRLDAVRMLASNGAISRGDIAAVGPSFSRTNPFLPEIEPQISVSPNASVVIPTVSTSQLPKLSGGEPPPPAPKMLPQIQQVEVSSDTLKTQLVEEQTRLAAIEKFIADGNKARVDQQVKVDALNKQLEAINPPENPNQTIRNYLDQQAKLREARAEQLAKIKTFQTEHGVKLVDLLPKRAPIDAARARKIGR